MRKSAKVLSVFWHGVGPDSRPPEFDSKDPSASVFRNQVQFLTRYYTPISVWDFLRIVQNEEAIDSYAKPPVLLGFDDGFQSVILNACPILMEFGAPAVLFVVGEVIKNTDFLPWFVEMKHMIRNALHRRLVHRGVSLDLSGHQDRATARRLTVAAFRACRSEMERQSLLDDLARATGVARPVGDDVDEDLRFVTRSDLARLGGSSILAVASHAMTHRHLADLSYGEQVYELAESDSLLREACLAYCPVVAYPAGSFNPTTVAIATNIYKAGFAVFSDASYRNRFAYPRVGFAQHSAPQMAYTLSSVRLNWLLPLKRVLHMAGLKKAED